MGGKSINFEDKKINKGTFYKNMNKILMLEKY